MIALNEVVLMDTVSTVGYVYVVVLLGQTTIL